MPRVALLGDQEAARRSDAGPEALSRIDVVNLDKWVAQLLRRAGYEYTISPRRQ